MAAAGPHSRSWRRFHVAVGVIAIVLLPLVSWFDGSGQLAWTMFSRTGQYRLVLAADGRAVNPTELAAAAAPGPTAYALAGADHFRHQDVVRATLRRHLTDVASLTCRLRPAAVVTARLEEKLHTTSDVRAPYTTRLKTSRKLPSVPNRCCGWSAGQPSRWMHGAARCFTRCSNVCQVSNRPTGSRLHSNGSSEQGAAAHRLRKSLARLAQ